MISYRIELRCDGCRLRAGLDSHTENRFVARSPLNVKEIARNRDMLQLAADANGWIEDGAEHFCPKCQKHPDFKRAHTVARSTPLVEQEAQCH